MKAEEKDCEDQLVNKTQQATNFEAGHFPFYYSAFEHFYMSLSIGLVKDFVHLHVSNSYI